MPLLREALQKKVSKLWTLLVRGGRGEVSTPFHNTTTGIEDNKEDNKEIRARRGKCEEGGIEQWSPDGADPPPLSNSPQCNAVQCSAMHLESHCKC